MTRNSLGRLAIAAFVLCASASCERYSVPLLVPPDTSGGQEGVLRILNAADASGSVEIYGIDDAGNTTGSASFSLDASAAAEFTATDLQSGNTDLGLDGGIGTNVGDVRLEIETDVQIVPLAFVRASDGTLSAMHDTVRAASTDVSGQYRYEVPIFYPSTEMTQVSRLRLINPGDAPAAVTIGGRDDTGAAATGGDVTLIIATGQVRTLTAQQLETGDTTLTGQLGAGTGRWRLTVSSDRPLQVMNVVAGTTGYWNNLSTTAVPGSAPAHIGAFNRLFVDQPISTRSASGGFALTVMAGERFTQTDESGVDTTTNPGSYDYEIIGPDAGRLTLDYDSGDECRMNLYFTARTTGWFASNCTGTDFPAEGARLGGSWSIQGALETATSVDCYADLLVQIGETCTYPGTTDEFSVNERGRGSFLDRLAGIRIRINNETINGRVYDFEASHQGDGVWRIDRVASGG